jgi:hypothetical protein
MFTGPIYPGTAADGGGGTGSPWSNPNNIKADDAANASGDISGGGYTSGTLVASNFGYSIATALKITGVVVEIDRSGSAVFDSGVYLRKNGGTLSSNKAGSFVNGVSTYGSPTDLWGFTTLTPADVNHVNFSVTYEAHNTSGGGNIDVDFIRMTVYYAPADKPFDPSIRKVYHAKVQLPNGTYMGLLPNVFDDFEFSDEIDTAGAPTTISVAGSSETARTDATTPLLDETGDPLLTEAGDPILVESSSSIVGVGSDTNMIVNGNTVIVYEFSPYYPNGHPIFRGRIDKWNDAHNRIIINLKSDGQDMDNTLLVGPPYVYTVDQQQLTATATFTLQESIGYDRLGQLWTAQVANLGGIYVRIYPTTTVHLTVSVYDSPLLGVLRGSATVVVLSTGGAAVDVVMPFSPRISTTIGQQYFFSAKVGSGESCNIAYSSGGGYSDGVMYGANYSGGSGGGSFVVSTGNDMYFKTASATGATIVSYGTQDPTTGMLVTALDDYNGDGGKIHYTAGSVTASGISVAYDFNLATILEAVNKFKELASSDFYWYVDLGTNELTMKPAGTTPDFIFVKGKHILDIDVTPSIEQVKNYIIFTGGEITAPGSSTAAPGSGINLYRVFKDDASIARYGRRIDRISDSRVTKQATAEALGGSALASQKDEKYLATIEVPDGVMDISLLKPGKTIGIAGFRNYKDQLVLQIVRRNYKPHKVILTVGVLPVRQSLSVEQLTRQLIAEQTVANPASPS